MSKWRLFAKSKNIENNNYQNPSTIEYNQNQDMPNNKTNNIQELSSQKLAEHHDTLQTSNSSSKKGSSSRNTVTSKDQRVWRDVQAIEENIDSLHVRPSGISPSELDKKVDHIIKKKEK